MDIHSEGLKLLGDGVILPHYRILSFFLDDILADSYRVLDINSHSGSILEMLNLIGPHFDIEYIGVDSDKQNIEEAKEKNLNGVFRHISYDKMKLHSSSYDVIIAQDQFLSGDIMEKINNLFRASKKWIILFNFLVLPEGDSYSISEINGKKEKIYGVNHLRELMSIMSPSQLEYSFIVKNENPLEPTPAIFVIKI